MKTKTFSFGVQNKKHIKALNIEDAIDIFINTVLDVKYYIGRSIKYKFPENKITKIIDKKYKSLPDYQVIQIYEVNKVERINYTDDDKEYIFLREISIFEIDNIKKEKIKKITTNNSEHQISSSDKILDIFNNSLSINNVYKNQLHIYDKFKEIDQDIRLKLQEIKKQQNKLEEITKINEQYFEIQNKYKGSYNDIVQLTKGDEAPYNDKIHIFEKIRYMNEEMIFSNLENIHKIDFNSLEVFDEWLVDNYEKILPFKKCIVIFKPRRTSVDYLDNNIFFTVDKNIYNFKSYIVFRNGENLYRITSDFFDIKDVLFPNKEYLENKYKNIILDVLNKTDESFNDEHLYKFKELSIDEAIKNLLLMLTIESEILNDELKKLKEDQYIIRLTDFDIYLENINFTPDNNVSFAIIFKNKYRNNNKPLLTKNIKIDLNDYLYLNEINELIINEDKNSSIVSYKFSENYIKFFLLKNCSNSLIELNKLKKEPFNDNIKFYNTIFTLSCFTLGFDNYIEYFVKEELNDMTIDELEDLDICNDDLLIYDTFDLIPNFLKRKNIKYIPTVDIYTGERLIFACIKIEKSKERFIQNRFNKIIEKMKEPNIQQLDNIIFLQSLIDNTDIFPNLKKKINLTNLYDVENNFIIHNDYSFALSDKFSDNIVDYDSYLDSLMLNKLNKDDKVYIIDNKNNHIELKHYGKNKYGEYELHNNSLYWKIFNDNVFTVTRYNKNMKKYYVKGNYESYGKSYNEYSNLIDRKYLIKINDIDIDKIKIYLSNVSFREKYFNTWFPLFVDILKLHIRRKVSYE